MTEYHAVPNSIKDKIRAITRFQPKYTAILLMTAGFLLLSAFCFLLFLTEGRIRPTGPGTALTETPVRWEVERLYYDENNHYYTIDGWAFIPDEEITSYNCHILLQHSETKEFFQLPSMQVQTENLTERFPEFSDSAQAMENGGFHSVFQRDKLDGDLEQYTIFIQYRNNGHDILIDTQRRLNDF